MKLTDFQVLTFDCYGTLIDWETGMINALKTLTDRVAHGLTRDQILKAHAFHESTQQKQTPSKNYQEILSIVYRRLAEGWGVPVRHEECVAYGKSVKDWPAFADSPDALRYLKQHYKLVILSNVDHESFAASNEKLGVDFDAIYTAVDIGTYKPDDKNFEHMLSHLARLGYGKSDILHTAESMFHDHAPANKHGLANCWIYRRHNQDGFGATMNPGDMPSYDFQFTSMEEMAEAHAHLVQNSA
ncbi:MAG: haloacid dehalogenase type II [Chloroflexota bacterium]